VANKLDILGVANSATNVQVWKDSDSPTTATRSGEYFHLALSVANGSYPQVYAKSLYGTNQQAAVGRSFVPPSTESYTHDADGNLTADGRWTAYVWDGENRLIEMRRDTSTPTDARQKLTFAYDHLGRRTRKTYFTHNGTSWVEQRDTCYLHDGWNLVAELDANSSNATLRTYVWGTDLSGSRAGAGGVGGLLWLNNSQSTGGMPTGIQFVAYDGNGNLAGLFAAADGSNTARYEYGPFGESLRATGPLAGANPVRWSTKVTDDETGLVYYGYRYYSSATGRWLSRDPIGEMGGTGLSRFVDNNSVTWTDYVGLFGQPWGCKGTCGAVIDDWILDEIRAQKQGFDNWRKRNANADGVEYLKWANGNQRYKDADYFQFNRWSDCGKDGTTDAEKAAPKPVRTRGCGFTVTICGNCVSSAVLGNIMYGFIGLYAGYDPANLELDSVRTKKRWRMNVDEYDLASYKFGGDLQVNWQRPRGLPTFPESTSQEARALDKTHFCRVFNDLLSRNPQAILEGRPAGNYNDLSTCEKCSSVTKETGHGGNEPTRLSP
jgi:RHS repeat-associated protein